MATGSGWSDRRVRGVVVVNAVGAAAAAVFAAVGVVNPVYVQPGSPSTAVAEFWAASSAVRTWSVTVPLLVGVLRGGPPSRSLLLVAGLVQLGDAALGITQRNLRMTILPAAMGLVHLTSARLLNT